MMESVARWTSYGLEAIATLFVFGVACFLVFLFVLFVMDRSQTADAIRRNYPVIGRFRGLFTRLGEFFRQYFFAMDREELPFNRAEREWVYKSSEGVDNTSAFGSTRSLQPPGTIIFANATYPPLDDETTDVPDITIGPYCRRPYSTGSILNISAMSFGALSRPAVRALGKGAKQAQCWLNTGEGGISPYHLESGCDLVFQLGTAKYGARTPEGALDPERLREAADHPQVRMIELKLSQGAKPGKGGILPGEKVTDEIAAIRGIPAGRDSISPNRHPEASNDGELLDLVNHIREVSGRPVGIKAVIGDLGWVDRFLDEVCKRDIREAPDFFTIDSGDGGTGAAPMPLMDNMGLTIRETLPYFVDALATRGLKDRIRVIATGKLITPADVAWAYCAGADFVATARGFMFALGCIQSLKCNKNTCPTGITTHDPYLQQGLDPTDKAVRVANYVNKMRYGVGIIAHSCGVANPRDLKRHHCRVVIGGNTTKPLSEMFPGPPTPLAG